MQSCTKAFYFLRFLNSSKLTLFFLLHFKIANLLFKDALVLFAVSQLGWASVEYSQDFLALEFLGYDYRLAYA